jgi:hypothetical protein
MTRVWRELAEMSTVGTDVLGNQNLREVGDCVDDWSALYQPYLGYVIWFLPRLFYFFFAIARALVASVCGYKPSDAPHSGRRRDRGKINISSLSTG